MPPDHPTSSPHDGVAPAPSTSTDAQAHADESTSSAGLGAARKFIGRVAQLDLAAVTAVLATWREAMRQTSDAWFAAEEAVGHAVVASGRHREQKPLLLNVAEAFAHMVWYGGQGRWESATPEPELRTQSTEASGQYVATVAMLALLVRDHIEPASFELLYRPFEAHIPLSALGRE